MELDRETLLTTFFAEAEDHLAGMQEALLALEARPEDGEALAAVFRGAHTLKGNAVSLDCPALASLAHAVEELLERLRRRVLRVTPDLVTLLLQALDGLRSLTRATAAGGAAPAAPRELIERLAAAAASAPSPIATAPVGPERPAASAEAEAPAPARGHTLRVDVARLDRLLDLVGEIAVERGRLDQILEGAGLPAALETHRGADQLFRDVQELILQTRLVPLGPAFRAHARTVRDMAAALGKQARLVIEGEDVEVDTSVVEQLRDPLTHMLRNALDHGLEEPAVRLARGKPAAGLVRLRALRESGGILVELCDDGAGLDLERIRQQARARGREAARLGPDELRQLIFEPGFSTAGRVTGVSGRGVGLDVVRRNVEALRGSVAVASRAGQGTTFSIRLPLTLAIIEGFGVVAAGETYVVPLDAVSECLDLPGQGFPREGPGVLELRGAPLPCLRLRSHFGQPGGGGRESVVVVEHGGGRAGLVVDGLLGERQTVLKPLGSLFRKVAGVSGSAILGSGRVALILDVPALLREAQQAGATRT